MSISNYGENLLLKSLKNESAAIEKVYVKLHTGDPGEEGTANGATETTRKGPVSWGSITGGTLKNSAAIKWEGVSTTETYKYVSLWDAVTAGNPLWSGPLTAEKAMSSGDNFELKVEELAVSLD